ncbi:MAG TPA: chorismate synthase [Halanaerobiales bacterium]|nr:chorismate synthase [Halanaerobiales bacterium]
MFTYLTAGESHGKEITAIIKQVPAGLRIKKSLINQELIRRQGGYGRGGRMDIEKDRVEITSGVRHGKTLGSPIALVIENKDWKNWQKEMSIEPIDEEKKDPMTKPRPGHADLPGAIKYNSRDLRNILERASARETAIRTAVGAICKQFLDKFAIKVFSHVIQIGSVKASAWEKREINRIKNNELSQKDIKKYFDKVEESPLRCGDKEIEEEMINLINETKQAGNSIGGVVELLVFGLPIGLGSHVHWDEKLDGKLAQALMSIQAIKAVEFGTGFKSAEHKGSKVHDEIYYDHDKTRFYRTSNNAGGIEGGMSNGEPLIIQIAMKPIPTLKKPLHSVDLESKSERSASKERSDVCAVPSASIVGEAVVSSVLAKAFSKKFGGDSIKEIIRNYQAYQDYVKNY